MKESDLYLPLKQFLEAKDFEVKGEVKDCDVFAVRAEAEPVIVEFKLSLNLSVVLQAVDRLVLSSQVYIGLPKSYKMARKRKSKILKLLKMLGLGLIVIDPGLKKGSVDVLIEPKEYKPRKSKTKLQRHLKEFHTRIGDPNLGGSTTLKGRVTAYRQRSIIIAEYLIKNGATKASTVAEKTQDTKARDILYKNYYGWFESSKHGIYQMSEQGAEEVKSWLIVN